MEHKGQAIWIQPASGSSTPAGDSGGCGPCSTLPLPADPAQVGEPLLEGPGEQLVAVLAALRRVQELRDARDIVSSGRVQAVRIVGGEATLTLRMGQGLCSDAHALAERAFEALREALPDTDLYLHHDRPTGCAGRLARD